MSTGFRCGMVVVAGLLLAGGLYAGRSGRPNVTTTGVHRAGSLVLGYPRSLSPRVAHLLNNNDVGVSKIISPGEYVPLGDTVIPRAAVKNFGTQPQTNVPVICVVYDSAAAARIYGPDTVYAASLDSGGVDTVAFPFWVPPSQQRVYFDTMTTALSGDENTTNDWKPGRFVVSESCVGWLTYNDGVFSNAITWPGPGEWATRYAMPLRPLMVDSANVWVTSFNGADFVEQVFIYGNDGPSHVPGTVLGNWSGTFHTSIWNSLYKNTVFFTPPVTVNYDSFFVSYYEQTTFNGGYIYVGMCYDGAPSGTDWARYHYPSGNWGLFSDGYLSFGIDAHYEGLMLDASPESITVPHGPLDSSTTFNPQIVVKNAGVDRTNIPVAFNITRIPDRDTVYSGQANSGPVAAGHEVTVTFADSVTLPPGHYAMTGITLLSFDGNPANDTLVRHFVVEYTGVADDSAGISPGRDPSLTIAPNPLMGGLATVRYNLPWAGLVTLKVVDVTGRTVLARTMAAGRTGAADLDLRKLNAGVYLVKVATEGYSATQKLVVER